MTMNCKIELFGTLGKEPKLVSNKNFPFLVFTVATRDSYHDMNTGKLKEKTLWHEVIVFNPDVIQAAKELQKGEKVTITGTISYKPIDTASGYKTSHATVIAMAVQTV